ncbi:MAG TPA: rhodanese-like domain-containing protein [Candidatus Paceibacterota bacterium]
MAKIVTVEELKKKIDNKEDFYLIDALGENSFKARHIPGAKNIPNDIDFMERFEREIGAPKNAEIITYCSSDHCMASVQAAKYLEEAGYTNVSHFKGGIAGWQEAGYEFSGI